MSNLITVKSPREIEQMRVAGKITAEARSLGRQLVAPGITTQEINKEIFKFIKSKGATPSFLGYGGFPGSACISVNDALPISRPHRHRQHRRRRHQKRLAGRLLRHVRSGRDL